MGRRRAALTLAQRKIIRQKFISQNIAQRQTEEFMRVLPRCQHGNVTTVCQICKKESDSMEILF